MDLSSESPEALSDILMAVSAAGMHPWLWEITTGRVTWSHGIDELFGLEANAHVKTFDAYMGALPAEDRPIVADAIERALRGDTPDYYVEHRVGPSDARRWVACRGRLLRDAKGAPVRLTGVVWDITSQREAAARIERLGRQWSTVREINRHVLHARSEQDLFENACRIAIDDGGFRLAWVGLVTADRERLVPAVRAGPDADCVKDLRVDLAETPFGRGPAARAVRDAAPVVVNDLLDCEDPPPWRANAVARGHRSVGSFPLRRDGLVIGVISVSSANTGTFDEEQVAALAQLADDLSYVLDLIQGDARRRATEAALRSSEERYRAVFEQAFEGIFTVAPTLHIIDANESACRMLGYARAEMLARTATEIIHRDDLARVPIRFSTIPPGGVILSERRFVRKDGSVMEGELTTKSLLDGNFQVVVRDVTERKQVQEQLLLTDRLSALGRLASGVAHEINNPLAYVMLNLEMLSTRLQRLDDPPDRDAVRKLLAGLRDAHDGAERMRRIVRTLSTFGRGDEDRIGPVDVNGALDSAVELGSMQVRHRAKVVRRYGAVHPVAANAYRLGQVFLNLLVNAADAVPEGNPDNEIVLSTLTREDGWVLVTVSDNGGGIPAELRSRIFDPFFTTKPVGKGTGLGLAVCHAIVSSVEGTISCDSRDGGGTLFTVALRPYRAEATAEVAEDAVLATTTSHRTRGRVLLADDDARLAKAFALTLAAHETVVVTSGREALERARSEPFDCILCDVMMGDFSGVDVHDALERDGRGVERRIVFVTGGAVTEAARAGLARVPNRVVEKPVDGEHLRRIVDEAVAQAIASRALG